MQWEARHIQQYDEWRDWFAWYPVKIGTKRVWLEIVQRTQVAPLDRAFIHPLYVAPWSYKHIQCHQM